jgi:hypothetical protein
MPSMWFSCTGTFRASSIAAAVGGSVRVPSLRPAHRAATGRDQSRALRSGAEGAPQHAHGPHQLVRSPSLAPLVDEQDEEEER